MKLTPQKAINKAYRRQSVNKDDLENFKAELLILLDSVNGESEEHHKNHLVQFLNDSFYKGKYYINTKDRIDCVINSGSKEKDDVNVIIEHKSPSNKSEMISTKDINRKALQESILYYMRERFDKDGKDNNTNLKQILITNNTDVFIFDAVIIETVFAKNKKFKKDFIEFEAGQKSGKDTGFFYESIAKPFIESIKDKLEYTYVNLEDYRKQIQSSDNDSKILNLYKLFSPTHLLKLNFANDSNSLDRNFYNELLHIIGLEEVKDGGKKLIRQCKNPNYGSILENTIDQVKTEVRLSDVPNYKSFGETRDEQIYNISLELVITWINRILFLKLLESQLISYNKSNEYKFVDTKNLSDYDDLYQLFFKVLAVKTNDRRRDIAELYKQVPYLNSSLFEITELERKAIGINTLANHLKLPLASSTVLKDNNGKKVSGDKEALSYLLEFLDAYNFSSEGTAQVQDDNKTLVNAAVLGLIYEKLNGYKDGSFFTPGYITMYMCRETIRRAVVQKFNDTIEDVTFDSFDDLAAYTRRYFKANDITRFNEIINTLHICDPAVGSGHFLVSALNEVIAIKHELGILADKEFKPLPVDLEIQNDELMITDRFDELFSYNPKSKDSQIIQETLFHEKQTIIENCLFGVDINPNSVKICRLRLWIELLKNTYYKADGELEVLPNIDINIKCGNSLISRFDIDTPISKALKKSKLKIQDYKDAVYGYKNAQSKEQKEDLENLINTIKGNFESEVASNDKRKVKLAKLRGELLSLETQSTMFERNKAEEKAHKKQVKVYDTDITKLATELDEIRSNRIYDNAFEWRFEFPEVLADNGDFIGFDVVIGNPPYIRQEEFKEIKSYLESNYQTYKGTADLFVYFVELGLRNIKPNGDFNYIIPNKWMRAGYGDKLRQYVKSHRVNEILDFGDLPVFDNATTYPSILSLSKLEAVDKFKAVNIDTLDYPAGLNEYLEANKLEVLSDELQDTGWTLTDSKVQNLLTKLRNTGVPLKEYVDGKIYYGIKTGFNEAFVVDKATKDELISADPNCAEIIKPFLAGRDIKRYQNPKADKYLLFTRRGIEIEKYPSVLKYLNKYKKQLMPKPKDYIEMDWEGRKFGTYKWYEIQDAVDYYIEFENSKVMLPDISLKCEALIDTDNKFYCVNTAYIIPNLNMCDLGVLNSKLVMFFYSSISPTISGGYYRFTRQYLNQIPFIQLSAEEQQPIIYIVGKIQEAKKANPEADTSKLEAEIDQLVYKLYDLTDDEIAIVEGV